VKNEALMGGIATSRQVGTRDDKQGRSGFAMTCAVCEGPSAVSDKGAGRGVSEGWRLFLTNSRNGAELLHKTE